ncbi:hypothetical protein PIIN_10250 [Serendipita indica DSM 11827]|uniref:Uncharacterized protein n=1 Tax=Serendipita indica (strain DSM 11827) TaxID=1109443 RepID=G4TY62_SERID|nr:hypothetical protein PIIN_10250 [Serendipita indica DSM 11827]
MSISLGLRLALLTSRLKPVSMVIIHVQQFFLQRFASILFSPTSGTAIVIVLLSASFQVSLHARRDFGSDNDVPQAPASDNFTPEITPSVLSSTTDVDRRFAIKATGKRQTTWSEDQVFVYQGISVADTETNRARRPNLESISFCRKARRTVTLKAGNAQARSSTSLPANRVYPKAA